MAKTSKTMASRKRPPPTTSNGVGGAGAYHPPVGGPLPTGIDALLAKYARHLPPGGTLTVRLVKGPTSASVDPIAARREAAKAAKAAQRKRSANDDGSGDESDGGGAAAAADGTGGKKKRGMNVPLTFPRIAKFSQTVTPPDFSKGNLKDGRLYEEEVPKLKDESDEEESTAYKPSNLETGGEAGADPASDQPNKKKKRRWRRNDPRPRRWVLQEKAEFFNRIRKRRQRSTTGGGVDDEDDEQGISNQYHAVDESNASKYVILRVAPTSSNAAAGPPSTPSSLVASEQITIQPVQGFHTFSQPYKFASLSMEEAENALEEQRKVVTRYMMHGKLSANNSSEAKAALAGGGGRGIGSAPKAMSHARLMGKLSGGGNSDGDDDDVMGDVRYSSAGGGRTSGARRELVSSMGDEGTTMDDDGVLGGANDSEFGGRRRFAKVSVNNKDADNGDGADKKGGGGGGKDSGAMTATGFDAGAMEEGFYQRDVAKEYEALDYDANEQFDNDDVNLGEDEMMDDGGGYGAADYDSGDDNMLDSEDDGSDEDGFEGMATSSGLKAMLAKARGDSPVTNTSVPPSDASDTSGKILSSPGGTGNGSPGGGKAIDSMIGAAKNKAEKKRASERAQQEDENKAAVGIEKDKDGKRLITLEAVRREIWLNNGAITSKRLMKKFDVTRKNPSRQALFKQIVLELCTMQKDADGNKLVLKQHYAKI